MREGVVEHGEDVGGRDDPGVVTPGGDQQPVVDLNRKQEEDGQGEIKSWKKVRGL